MRQMNLIPIAVVLLALTAGACAVSANTLIAGSAVLPAIGDTAEIPITLDTAEYGLAGYSITLTIGDPSIAEIAGMTYPVWSDPRFVYRSSGTNSVNVMVADIGDLVQTGASQVDLGSVVVRGVQAGTTEITVAVDQMDADDGRPMTPAGATGAIAVVLPPGSLQVSTTTTSGTPLTGAQIYVGGVLQDGKLTPATIDGVAPGITRVKVTLDLYVEEEKDVEVMSGQIAPVTFALVKKGGYRVTSTPVPANILVDGFDTTKVTPATIMGYDPRILHVVRVEAPGYLGKETSKKTIPGMAVPVAFTLTQAAVNEIPPYGSIRVLSTPEGAKVLVNGEDTETETTAEVERNAGEYRVSVTLEGYATPAERTVTVVPHETVTESFVLLPEPAPSLSCLWPADHKFVDLSLLPVADAQGNPLVLAVKTITTDEATASDKGSGGAQHSPDAAIRGDTAFQLRAERSGTGNGRVYVVTFTETDSRTGEVSTGSVEICVPRDGRDRCTCIDSGQKFDATKKN